MAYEQFGLGISTSKTKVLIISSNICLIASKYFPEQVMSFNHLGGEITISRDLVNEAIPQENKATKVSTCLNYTLYGTICSYIKNLK